jgi:PRTRC genetic system protein C
VTQQHQANFFNLPGQGAQPGSGPQAIQGYQPLADPAADPQPRVQGGYRKRLFQYSGQHWEDPGPEYTNAQVMATLAQSYPELENGTWSERELADGTIEVTFVKVYGEKGADVTARLIAHRLGQETQPTAIKAVTILNQLAQMDGQGQLTTATLLGMAAEIETAYREGELLQQAAKEILSRCLSLKPITHPQVPLGF